MDVLVSSLRLKMPCRPSSRELPTKPIWRCEGGLAGHAAGGHPRCILRTQTHRMQVSGELEMNGYEIVNVAVAERSKRHVAVAERSKRHVAVARRQAGLERQRRSPEYIYEA